MEKFIREDILLIENFISNEEAKKTINLLNLMEQKDPDFWKGISFYESYSSGYPEPGDPIFNECGLPDTWFKDLEQRFKEVTAKVAKVDVNKMSKISFHTQRWLPGAFAPLHSDNTSNDGTYGAFTRSRYATFLYLNDDFEGGELHFEKSGEDSEIILKPRTGLIAAFHGGHKNLHEVKVIKKSTRYTIGSFWDDREESDYPQETRDEWAKELAEVRAMQKEQQKEWQDIRKEDKRLSPDGHTYDAKEVEDAK